MIFLHQKYIADSDVHKKALLSPETIFLIY